MPIALFAAAALAGVAEDVARGTYLWQTGQDDLAVEVASAAVLAAPADLSAFRLHAALEITRGNGMSLEAATREWWSEASQDPVRRTALALVLAQRHPTKGGWCDEVTTLVKPVTEGEPHYWAVVADRLREDRCIGGTGHADAELRRIAAEGASGWADGVIAELEAGYVKDELPPKLERVWTEHPLLLARAGALWGDTVAGPGKPAAKRLTSKALEQAVESDDPVLVHAALLAYVAAEDLKKADAAAARLRTLDPAADTSLVRTLDEVTDPPEYAAIAACTEPHDPDDVLACLDEVALPPKGSLAAWREVQRARVLDYAGRLDEAYAAITAAWRAEPSHRFDARAFSRRALARKADFELALEASDHVIAGRVPFDAAALTAPQRAALAKDLDVRGALLRAAGRPAEALEPTAQAYTLLPTGARQIRLGLALAGAGRADEAVVQLAYGLAVEFDDTALVSEARDVLRPLVTSWGVELDELLASAMRLPGDEDAPRSPLVGKPFPIEAGLLPAPTDPKKPGVRVIVAWASWRPNAAAPLSRLAAIDKLYAAKGVQLRVIGVDPAEVAPPADAPPDVKWVGPAAMRTLRSVALPTAVVVDAKGTVTAVLAPYDASSLDLETAIDQALPAP